MVKLLTQVLRERIGLSGDYQETKSNGTTVYTQGKKQYTSTYVRQPAGIKDERKQSKYSPVEVRITKDTVEILSISTHKVSKSEGSYIAKPYITSRKVYDMSGRKLLEERYRSLREGDSRKQQLTLRRDYVKGEETSINTASDKGRTQTVPIKRGFISSAEVSRRSRAKPKTVTTTRTQTAQLKSSGTDLSSREKTLLPTREPIPQLFSKQTNQSLMSVAPRDDVTERRALRRSDLKAQEQRRTRQKIKDIGSVQSPFKKDQPANLTSISGENIYVAPKREVPTIIREGYKISPSLIKDDKFVGPGGETYKITAAQENRARTAKDYLSLYDKKTGDVQTLTIKRAELVDKSKSTDNFTGVIYPSAIDSAEGKQLSLNPDRDLQEEYGLNRKSGFKQRVEYLKSGVKDAEQSMGPLISIPYAYSKAGVLTAPLGLATYGALKLGSKLPGVSKAGKALSSTKAGKAVGKFAYEQGQGIVDVSTAAFYGAGAYFGAKKAREVGESELYGATKGVARTTGDLLGFSRGIQTGEKARLLYLANKKKGYIPISETDFQFVPDVTIPTPLSKLKTAAGTKAKQTHTTSDLPGGKVEGGYTYFTVEARPEMAGAKRQKLEQYPLYLGPALPGEKAPIYGGYVGFGGASGSSKPPQLTLLNKDVSVLVSDELISPISQKVSTASKSKQDLYKKGREVIKIQAEEGLSLGKSDIAAENLVGLSVERQVTKKVGTELRYKPTGKYSYVEGDVSNPFSIKPKFETPAQKVLRGYRETNFEVLGMGGTKRSKVDFYDLETMGYSPQRTTKAPTMAKKTKPRPEPIEIRVPKAPTMAKKTKPRAYDDYKIKELERAYARKAQKKPKADQLIDDLMGKPKRRSKAPSMKKQKKTKPTFESESRPISAGSLGGSLISPTGRSLSQSSYSKASSLSSGKPFSFGSGGSSSGGSLPGGKSSPSGGDSGGGTSSNIWGSSGGGSGGSRSGGSGGGGSSPIISTPGPSPGTFPGMLPFPFKPSGGVSSYNPKRRSRVRRSSTRQSTAFAVTFGIFGKEGGRKLEGTGLTIRPLTAPRKKKKKIRGIF